MTLDSFFYRIAEDNRRRPGDPTQDDDVSTVLVAAMANGRRLDVDPRDADVPTTLSRFVEGAFNRLASIFPDSTEGR
jgi:hypothetical protein